MDKKLIILDIDECLIHAAEKSIDGQHYDFYSDWCYVYKRPFVDDFILFCREHFNVALWTSSGWMHAELIVNQLFAEDYPFEFVWSFRNCTRKYDCEEFKEYYVKDLRK